MMFNTGKVIVVIAVVIFAKNGVALEANDVFSDPAITKAVYKNILPKGYTFADGIWRDDQGKTIEKPNVNFAGKYWVGLHSCGAECRYYSMLDLSTGTESRALDMFSTTEPPSRTRNGNLYVTNLVTHAKSNRLVAR